MFISYKNIFKPQNFLNEQLLEFKVTQGCQLMQQLKTVFLLV